MCLEIKKGGTKEMEEILHLYYENNAEKLHGVVNGIVKSFGGLSDMDMDDFYSLANEVFADIIRRYDDSRSFEAFLYSCLCNRVKTEMTKRNREKRKTEQLLVSIDAPIGEGETLTWRDVIPGRYDMEEEVLERNGESYSERMLKYLSRLSREQKKVLMLKAAGYMPREIRKNMKLTKKEYAEYHAAIHSDRNVSLLI